ncbi:MAG: hypothetical protein KZQ83_19805 [gamma proteobacterium symbiont of Taylorina sp.]|nr:hypothetical protein [gamma proteobacterium symbiont of Taylorina sp.]
MGQKTEFTAEEWDLLDDLSIEDNELDSSILIKVDKKFESSGNITLEVSQDSAEMLEEPAELIEALSAEKNISAEKQQKKKIIISRRSSGKPMSAQEEDAFKKQIQDLFDLLELEKEDKNHGIRVYQTDSSPSMPWRFH